MKKGLKEFPMLMVKGVASIKGLKGDKVQMVG